MPRHTNIHQQNSRRSAPGRSLGAALIALGLIATTSCTQDPEPEPVSNPVKLLQNVRVDLSNAAGVEAIEGTTISVAADGNSSAANTQYTTDEVVGELPVRISLQYRAGDKSGSDLTDLQGHSGPVEINMTVENLTVKPQVIEYDAAGQMRTETALVGAPLTIAASTTLPGVRADDVTPGSADGTTGTNGVLSSTEDGSSVVQWATVLAPPRSGASTTLRLVADVDDFQVPAIEVAVQPGLNTDMTADGVVSGAFSSGAGSEMELQRRTIALVADVNIVLTKAGSTITEVRRNLQETSQTLGVKTAEELSSNSESLAATMVRLKDDMEVLGSDLDAATKGTESVTLSQLQQTVSAVDSMLGDTSAVPPTVTVKGEGCVADVAKPQKSGTVYGSILTMASQLDAYATVSADCRNFVAGQLQTAIGPEKPTAEECAAEADKSKEAEDGSAFLSMTCSLLNSRVTIESALAGLVNQGAELVATLEPKLVEAAIANQKVSDDTLVDAQTQLAAILEGPETPDDYSTALAELGATIQAAEDSTRASVEATREAADAARSSIDGLRVKLNTIATTADNAQAELTEGLPFDRSMTAQNEALADDLCRIADGDDPRDGRLSMKDAERLRSYLTSVPCEALDEEGNPAPELTPPFGFQESQDVRLAGQSEAWAEVIRQTDTNAEDQAIGQAFTVLDESIKGIDIKLDAVRDAVTVLDNAATGNVTGTRSGLVKLQKTLDEAVTASGEVHDNLVNVKDQQATLGGEIEKALAEVSEDTAEKVEEAIASQTRKVSEIGDESTESVTTAFNSSIAGLKSTSGDVVKDAKGTVDNQRGELNEEGDALSAALSKSTESALARIASSTSGSTRDVDGARALLSASLNKVMMDLGDRTVNGSGLLGSMATNAAKADTADFQLALAAQNAEGYANIRSQDVAGLLLRQAQFKASLTAIDELPAFHLEVPAGATSQTLYTLTIGGGE
ncbi:hypothetical protein GD627_15330 [Arthrobacter yangruifuii]|uniref:Uncharacterized protein n=1 Tax=Arthrobacter yangruifuii TaxID=2606616 RepID=A0A5N6MEX7_9MICC|nr:hypothetical protein [Arthrobacter yangruifuii]KAD3456066.1 hypothetical protein GD627_15330 [Arthrobacter yangruifuii]